MRTTLEKAIEIGRLLTAQKAKCGHGKWLPWIKANLEFGDRQAQRYIRCYDHREKLPKATSKSDFTSLEEFLRLCEATNKPPQIVYEQSNKPRLVSVPGQEAPLMLGGRPLLTVSQALKSVTPGHDSSKEQPVEVSVVHLERSEKPPEEVLVVKLVKDEPEPPMLGSPIAFKKILKENKDKPFTVDLFRLLVLEIATASGLAPRLIDILMSNFEKTFK